MQLITISSGYHSIKAMPKCFLYGTCQAVCLGCLSCSLPVTYTTHKTGTGSYLPIVPWQLTVLDEQVAHVSFTHINKWTTTFLITDMFLTAFTLFFSIYMYLYHLKNYVTNLCMAQYITNLMIKWKTHRSSRADICGMKDPSQLKGMNTSTWDKHPPLFFIFASCGSGWHGGPCASSEMQCQCWEYVLHRISVMVQWFRDLSPFLLESASSRGIRWSQKKRKKEIFVGQLWSDAWLTPAHMPWARIQLSGHTKCKRGWKRWSRWMSRKAMGFCGLTESYCDMQDPQDPRGMQASL